MNNAITNLRIHRDLADDRYENQKFGFVKYKDHWEITPVSLLDPSSIPPSTDMKQISEILRSSHLEENSQCTYLKLAKRINDLIVEHNRRCEEQLYHSHSGVAWLTSRVTTTQFPRSFTLRVIRLFINHTFPECSSHAFYPLIQEMTKYLNSGEEGILLENLRILERMKSSMQYGITEGYPELLTLSTTRSFRERCREIRIEWDMVQSNGFIKNHPCWSFLGNKLSDLERAIFNKNFKELATTKQYYDYRQHQIKTYILHVPGKYDEIIASMTLTEESRKKYDRDEIQFIEQRTEQLKTAYQACCYELIEDHAKNFFLMGPSARREALELTEQLKKTIHSDTAACKRLDQMHQFCVLNERLLRANLSSVFSQATSATLETIRNQALQDLEKLKRLYAELFPEGKETIVNKHASIHKDIHDCYEGTLLEKKSIHTFAVQWNVDEFIDELEEASDFANARFRASEKLKQFNVPAVEREFLTPEELKFIEDQSKLCEETFIDWTLSYLARKARHYVHESIKETLRHYLEEHPDLPQARRSRLSAALERYIPAIIELVLITDFVYREEGVFREAGLTTLYFNLYDYFTAIRKLSKLHTELFPDEANIWEESLYDKQEECRQHFNHRNAAQLFCVLQHATRGTPFFSEYPTDQSIAELARATLNYDDGKKVLCLPKERFDSALEEAASKLLTTFESAFTEWLKQFYLHHRQTSAPRAPITVEILDLLSHFLSFMSDNAKLEVIRPHLNRMTPFLKRYIAYETAKEYQDQFYTLVKRYIEQRLSREPGMMLEEKGIMLDSQPGNRMVYLCLPQASLWFYHPITGRSHALPFLMRRLDATLDELIQHRRHLFALREEMADWERHPDKDRRLIKDVDLLLAPEHIHKTPQFVVLFSEKNEFVVFFNKDQKLNCSDIAVRMKRGSLKDPAMSVISSLKQFEEVKQRFYEQQQFDQLDGMFRLSDRILRTISPASVLNLPKMPADRVRSSLSYLLGILKTINFRNPKQPGYIAPVYEGKDIRATLREMVKIVKGMLKYSGIPQKSPMKEQWFLRFESLLRNVILIIRDRHEAAPEDKKARVLLDNQTTVLDIAKIAHYCGTRWIIEVNTVFRIVSGSIDLLFVGDMPTIMHRTIDLFKTGILEEMVNETPSNTEYQSSHGLIYYMQALARLNYKLPEAELADYDDTYDALGKRGRYKTDKDVENGFLSKLKGSTAASVIHADLNRCMVAEARQNILGALRLMLTSHPPELASLQQEQAEVLQKIKVLQGQECPLTEVEQEWLRIVAMCKRADYFSQLPEMKTLRARIQDLITRKPSYVLTRIKELDEAEFNAQKAKETALTELEAAFLKTLYDKKTLGPEDRLTLEKLAAQKPCQLEIHEFGGQGIYAKIGKDPYCRPDLIRRFGLVVIPFGRQIDTLKEQHASQIHELLDEELLKQGWLRKESRFMQKPGTHEWHPEEVLLLTVEGTLKLIFSAGFLEAQA